LQVSGLVAAVAIDPIERWLQVLILWVRTELKRYAREITAKILTGEQGLDELLQLGR
jgi:hypothetical protein